MQWLVAARILLAGLAGMFFIVRSDNSTRRKSAAGSFITGLAEAIDPNAAMIAVENEKRADMEREEDSGDPPNPDAR